MTIKNKADAQQVIEGKEGAARAARKAEANDRARHNSYRADQHQRTAERFEREAADLRAVLLTLPG